MLDYTIPAKSYRYLNDKKPTKITKNDKKFGKYALKSIAKHKTTNNLIYNGLKLWYINKRKM